MLETWLIEGLSGWLLAGESAPIMGEGKEVKGAGDGQGDRAQST